MIMKKNLDKNIRRKVTTAAIAATTGASLLVSSAYADPDELLHPKPLIQTLHQEDDNEDEFNFSRRSLSERFRIWFSGMPLWIRVSVGLPLWAIGFILVTLANTLWTRFISPILGTVVVVALVAGILLLTLVFIGKMMLPYVPFRKFFNLKAVIIVLGGIGAYMLMDNLFANVWSEYKEYSQQIMLATFIITLICGLYQYYHDLHETRLIVSTDDYSFES